MTFTLTLPSSDIQIAYQKALAKAAKSVQLKGFRRGKAPLDLVAASLDQTKLYDEAFQAVFPPAYREYLAAHQLRPVTQPKITIKSAKPQTDWLIEVEIAEKPPVILNDYRTIITTLNRQLNPPKKAPKQTSKKAVGPAKTADDTWVNAIFSALLKTCKVDLPPLLIDQAVDHELAHLLEQIQKLGLSVDQYLASTKKTAEQLRQDTATQVRSDLQLDFILEAIAHEQKLTPTPEKIDQFIAKIEDPVVRSRVEQDPSIRSSIYTTLLRTQVVDYLKTL